MMEGRAGWSGISLLKGKRNARRALECSRTSGGVPKPFFDFQPPVHAAMPLRLYLPFGNLLSKVFLYASHTVPYRLSRKFLQTHDFRIAQSYFHQIAGSDL